MIAIIDYGMGNIHSVQKALEISGAKTLVTNDPKYLSDCDKIVLPGVGAFDDAVVDLKKQGLFAAISNAAREGKIILGICLGLQLFFESSQEAQTQKGLSLVKGEVRKFSASRDFKVPHMGWNRLMIKNFGCPLLKKISEGEQVYFCHSYYPFPDDSRITAAATDYGIEFSSVIWQDNIFGVQFHPEKSQQTGLKMLDNFVKM